MKVNVENSMDVLVVKSSSRPQVIAKIKIEIMKVLSSLRYLGCCFSDDGSTQGGVEK